jgi:hypothetical protein
LQIGGVVEPPEKRELRGTEFERGRYTKQCAWRLSLLEEVGSDLETENFELIKSGEGGDIGVYRVKVQPWSNRSP